MVDSEKSNTDYPTFDFRPSHVQHVRTSPRNASIAVSSFASAKALLDVLPEGNLSLTSTLTIWSKDISQPARLPELSSTSFESNWFDHNCYENLSVHGTLNATGTDPNSSLWQEWCNWLTTAGVLIEFCEIPKNCPQQLRFIPDPLYRWIYFVHEFVAPDLFTWDLTPEQLDEWKQRCDEVGFGDFHHTAAEDDGTWSYHLGAAVGERLPLENLYSLQWFPDSFHVCSEIRNLIHESRKLLSVLGPRLLRPDDDVASDSQREMADPVRLVVATGNTAATGDTAVAKGGKSWKKQAKRKPGRKKGTTKVSPEADQKIVDAWKKGKGSFKKKADVDIALNLPAGTTHAAVERHRKRSK